MSELPLTKVLMIAVTIGWIFLTPIFSFCCFVEFYHDDIENPLAISAIFAVGGAIVVTAVYLLIIVVLFVLHFATNQVRQ